MTVTANYNVAWSDKNPAAQNPCQPRCPSKKGCLFPVHWLCVHTCTCGRVCYPPVCTAGAGGERGLAQSGHTTGPPPEDEPGDLRLFRPGLAGCWVSPPCLVQPLQALTLAPNPMLTSPGSPFSPLTPFIPGRPWEEWWGELLGADQDHGLSHHLSPH